MYIVLCYAEVYIIQIWFYFSALSEINAFLERSAVNPVVLLFWKGFLVPKLP